jgi:hypothetical protein
MTTQGPITGVDLAAPDSEKNGMTMYLPHVGRPGCGYTVLIDEQVELHRLGLLPVRCKSCHELLTDCEAA